MKQTVSISRPLARGGAVLILCLVAACVQRRADGLRGSDTDSAGTATESTLKRDTGITAVQRSSANLTAVTATPSTLPPRTQSPGSDTMTTQADVMALAQRHPIVPISGIPAAKLPDTFNEMRGGTRRHEALDIIAPRGTPVHSADDGIVIKLFTSKAGGLTVYVSGPDQRFVYYYAHLDSYATGLAEGQTLHKGDVLGQVGTTGDADPNVPHLHFAIARVDNIKQWWKGEPINPTAVLQAAAQTRAQ